MTQSIKSTMKLKQKKRFYDMRNYLNEHKWN